MSGMDKVGLIEFKQEARKGLEFTVGPPAERLDDIEEKIDFLAIWLSEVDEMLAMEALKKGGVKKE